MRSFVTTVASAIVVSAFGTGGDDPALTNYKTGTPGFLTNPTHASADVIMADVDSSGLGDYGHASVLRRISAAYNQPSLIPALLDLFVEDNEDIQWCDPYPNCVTGKDAIKDYLHRFANVLVDSFATPLVAESADQEFFIGNGGSKYYPAMLFSVQTSAAHTAAFQKQYNTTRPSTCIVGAPVMVQWFIDTSGGPESASTSKLLQVRLFYDEKTRYQGAKACGAQEHLLLGDGYENPENRKNLDNLFTDLVTNVIEHSVQDARNVEAWQNLFTHKPGELENIELCAFYPYCFYGQDALDSLWTWQDTDGEMEHIHYGQSSGSNDGNPIMVSGNVGSTMTFFANTDQGCLESHWQFMIIHLAEDSDRAQAMSILSYPPEFSMKLHDCHAKGFNMLENGDDLAAHPDPTK